MPPSLNQREEDADSIAVGEDVEYVEKTYGKDQASAPSKNPKTLRRRFSVTDLVDPTQPWQLPASGTMLGFFDFVPRHLREGPWSLTAILFLFGIMYSLTIILLALNMLHEPV